MSLIYYNDAVSKMRLTNTEHNWVTFIPYQLKTIWNNCLFSSHYSAAVIERPVSRSLVNVQSLRMTRTVGAIPRFNNGVHRPSFQVKTLVCLFACGGNQPARYNSECAKFPLKSNLLCHSGSNLTVSIWEMQNKMAVMTALVLKCFWNLL